MANLRILVIDDEEHVREALRLLLGFEGHSVDSAENGAQGLELVRDRDYDLVFTDYVMPVMQGDEFARKARALKPHLPIVMITAHVHSADFAKNPIGIDHLIGKPFTLDELRKAIWMMTEGKSQRAACEI